MAAEQHRFNAIGSPQATAQRRKKAIPASSVQIERDKQADLAKTRGAQLESTRVEIGRLEAELVDCTKQREVLGARFATNQAALNEKHAAVEACEQREEDLKRELKDCEKDKARLNAELTTERQIKKEREESFRAEKAEVERQLKQCQAEKATLKREKAGLANEKVTLGQQVHRLQVRESQLADAIAKAGSRERALEATLEDKKAKLARCEAEEARLNAALTAQGEQFSTLKRLLGEKELAAAQCEEALKAREAAQAVLQAQTASDIQDYEGKLTAARNSRAEAERERDKAIQRIAEWEDRVDQLGAELDVSRTESEALKAEMETMAAEVQKTKAELAKMEKTRNAAVRKRRQLAKTRCRGRQLRPKLPMRSPWRERSRSPTPALATCFQTLNACDRRLLRLQRRATPRRSLSASGGRDWKWPAPARLSPQWCCGERPSTRPSPTTESPKKPPFLIAFR